MYRKPHLFFLNFFTSLHWAAIPPRLQNIYLLIRWAFTDKSPCPDGAYILGTPLCFNRGNKSNQRREDRSEWPSLLPGTLLSSFKNRSWMLISGMFWLWPKLYFYWLIFLSLWSELGFLPTFKYWHLQCYFFTLLFLLLSGGVEHFTVLHIEWSLFLKFSVSYLRKNNLYFKWKLLLYKWLWKSATGMFLDCIGLGKENNRLKSDIKK